MLETIWFILWGILWAVYFMLDGYDFGLGMLMPFLARDDKETRVFYNAMGPFWDGNEVWLITVGGVTFAAFPTTYAVMFRTLYTPLLLILFALIIRAVSFEFRGKIDSTAWRKLWDTCLFVGSFLPALLFGVAFANIFQGIPFDKDHIFQGNLLTLLNPYGILGGVLFVAMFLLHGSLWLAIKAEGPLYPEGLCDCFFAVGSPALCGCSISRIHVVRNFPVSELPEQPGTFYYTADHSCGYGYYENFHGESGLVEIVVRIQCHNYECCDVRRGRTLSQPLSVKLE